MYNEGKIKEAVLLDLQCGIIKKAEVASQLIARGLPPSDTLRLSKELSQDPTLVFLEDIVMYSKRDTIA